jgi:Family of unknown function (DUF5662)
MTDLSYDSRDETMAHIEAVQRNMDEVTGDLTTRAYVHDRSKLRDPEKACYDKFTPLLAGMEYGSAEYKQALKDMGPALRHHYEQNSHHPEHFRNGIRGMSLLDLMEMLADWQASISRGKNGDLQRSVVVNQERFGYSDELGEILLNTARELGWIS